MNKKKVVLSILAIIIFIIMAVMVISERSNNFDNAIYSIISLLHCNVVTVICKMLSFLCSTVFLIIFMALTMIFVKDKKKAFYICLNISLCCLLNQFVKFIIQRDRPIDINLIWENGYSFPSGHSMVSLAGYGFFIHLINNSEIKHKKIYSIVFNILIIFTGLSRIYLGVHYASDVIAGFSLSFVYLMIYIKFYEKRMS